MKLNKLALGAFTAILSTGLLFGCGINNDEQEPDPTEEPSEQQDQGNELEEEQNQSNDEQEPDPTEEPSEQQDQGNELEEEQNQ